MTLRRVYLDYLEDLLDALCKSQRFVAGMTFEQFVEDEKTVFAVTRALEVVGEAAKQIPPEIQHRYAAVPWREMARMRDKLIHHYFGVDVRVVWKTVQDDVHILIPLIQEALDLERESE